MTSHWAATSVGILVLALIVAGALISARARRRRRAFIKTRIRREAEK
jgi:hypothetical protein